MIEKKAALIPAPPVLVQEMRLSVEVYSTSEIQILQTEKQIQRYLKVPARKNRQSNARLD